jgi:four helix bundle protein
MSIRNQKPKKMGYYKDLLAFQKAYKLAMAIFEISKRFPTEERYSLTDQIRKSSRSVCTNLAEAYRRKKYKAYFLSKLNDCDTENAETEIWLSFARDCGYISTVEHTQLDLLNNEVGKLLWYMMNNPEKFTGSQAPA